MAKTRKKWSRDGTYPKIPIVIVFATSNRSNSKMKMKVVRNRNIDQLMECNYCLLYTSPSPRDRQKSRMPSSA